MNLVIYGTRPEEIKLYPFSKYPGLVFVQVNQSPDLHQGLIKPDFRVEESELETFVKSQSWDKVIVQGDTRTAFRAAVAAFELSIPVVHVEAGMRTFDLTQPFPEEGYRQMIDCIATYKFSSTPEAAKNCGGIYVGQTSIDTLVEFAGEIREGNYDIVTLHRRENLSRATELARFVKSTSDNPHVVVHPNPTGKRFSKSFNKTFKPMGYRDFVKLLAGCRRVFTDSGGLQEEAIALGKEVVVLRSKSERGHGESYEPGATKKIMEVLNAS